MCLWTCASERLSKGVLLCVTLISYACRSVLPKTGAHQIKSKKKLKSSSWRVFESHFGSLGPFPGLCLCQVRLKNKSRGKAFLVNKDDLALPHCTCVITPTQCVTNALHSQATASATALYFLVRVHPCADHKPRISLQAALLLNFDRDAKPAPIRDQLLRGALSSHPPARPKVVRPDVRLDGVKLGRGWVAGVGIEENVDAAVREYGHMFLGLAEGSAFSSSSSASRTMYAATAGQAASIVFPAPFPKNSGHNPSVLQHCRSLVPVQFSFCCGTRLQCLLWRAATSGSSGGSRII